ncbi:MAG TPA: hypothetical protein VFM14_12465, partial [Gemmatimonadales bacterium]|nr:hypothetical protein [Gemmatimonadales bacterium]
QRCVSQGRKLWFAHATTLIETRMYRSLAHLIEGWSKNIYLGALRSFPEEPVLRGLVPLLLAAPLLFWLLPPVGLAWSLSGAALPDGLAAAAVVATTLSAVFWMLVCYGMKIPPWYGLGFPLGAAVVLFIAARSLVRGRRAVEWKGRTYRVD